MIQRASIKCKQSPVYGVFDRYFHIPRDETRTWSSLSPRNLPVKFCTNPSTIFLAIVATDRQRQTHRLTDTQTNAAENIFLTFAGIITSATYGGDTVLIASICTVFDAAVAAILTSLGSGGVTNIIVQRPK